MGKLQNDIVACVGGGSNSIGLFHLFLKDYRVKITGIEAGVLVHISESMRPYLMAKNLGTMS